MKYLSPKEREILKEFSQSSTGEIIRRLIENNLQELGDINTLDKDPVKSRNIALSHLKDNLLSYLKEPQPTDDTEVDTYE